jgi:MoeA N-terminal region (domain I and II)
MTQTLISVEEAWRIIQAKSCERPSEWVSLEQAVGAIAVEDWKCDRDQPPFNRVMMDGMAIRFADFESGKRSFRIGGLHAAGADPNEVSMDSEALEIMTGAALPNGWDTVIPYEMLQISQTEATCLVSAIKEGQHVHLSGTDFKENQMICMAGRRIGPAEIGIAASIGLSQIRVEKKYKVLIVATGNELVAVNTIPLPHQIRMSNVHALAADKPVASFLFAIRLDFAVRRSKHGQARFCSICFDANRGDYTFTRHCSAARKAHVVCLQRELSCFCASGQSRFYLSLLGPVCSTFFNQADRLQSEHRFFREWAFNDAICTCYEK